MARKKGAAPAAPDPSVLVLPVVVAVDIDAFRVWHDDLYQGEEVPDTETAIREVIGEGVRAMRDELDHVPGITISYAETTLVDSTDDAPDGL